jgi:hypothetical protein
LEKQPSTGFVEPGAVLGSKSEVEAVRGLIGKPSLGFLGEACGMIVEDHLIAVWAR